MPDRVADADPPQILARLREGLGESERDRMEAPAWIRGLGIVVVLAIVSVVVAMAVYANPW